MTAGVSGARRSGRWMPGLTGVVLVAGLGSTGCSLDGLLHSDQLPPDVSDPAITQTPAGALEAYNAALVQFKTAFGAAPGSNGGVNVISAVTATGLLSDELTWPESSNSSSFSLTGLDQRNMPEAGTNGVNNGADGRQAYSALQKVRGQASQAIGLLTDYQPAQPALAGHLYAIEGYAELFLAELFCSGVPLGTLDYHGDFTYRAGSTTMQVFAHAAALFDTALVLAGDSVRITNLALLGKGRALLGQGNYAAAAAAVTAVPDGYRYTLSYNNVTTGTTSAQSFARWPANGQTWDLMVPDSEGFNGLDWRSSNDPRTPIRQGTYTSGNGSYTSYVPANYDTTGVGSIVLASGVEARLVEAEAALQAGSGTWLTTLNALRTDGTYDATETSPPDTLWHAGTGGVAGLPPLSDPGTLSGRVDLMFRERAFWLFLTGHRQGDLRRLIRQYGRAEAEVYPVGPYPYTLAPFGSDVTAPIPTTEFINPLYTGCASRGA